MLRLSRLPFVLSPRAALFLSAAAFAALAAGIWRWQAVQRINTAAMLVQDLQGRLQAASAASAAGKPESSTTDFTQHLPAAASADAFVGELQRASAAAGVAFVSVAVGSREPTVQTLGRTEVNLALRGSYPHLKSVLAQALERFPGLVVQHLTLRRLASPTEVEANASLLLVTSALPAPPSAGP